MCFVGIIPTVYKKIKDVACRLPTFLPTSANEKTVE